MDVTIRRNSLEPKKNARPAPLLAKKLLTSGLQGMPVKCIAIRSDAVFTVDFYINKVECLKTDKEQILQLLNV